MDETTFDEQLVDVFIQLSQGDLTARLPRSGQRDTRDVIAYLVNVLAEELTELFAERETARKGLETAVLELGDVLARHAAGDFTARADRRFDGSPADVLAFQVNSAGEEIGGLVQDLQEQQERIEREARTRAASRLTAISVLAAGVAHEVNNPLTYTLMNLQLVQEELAAMNRSGDSNFDALLESLRDAETGVHRVATIARTMRQLSPGDQERKSRFNVTDVVDGSLRMLRNIVGHKAQLTCTHRQGMTAHGDAARIGQVVINLVHNAVLAFKDSPVMDNRIDVVTYQEITEIGDRSMAVIEVRDNGVGIEPETLPRVFDAFFSTRGPQEGTGLGLSISRQTMLEAEGDLTVESTLGVGTVFRASLPVDADGAQDEESQDPQAASGGQRARILVVDDEPAILDIVRRSLEGHAVTTATNGATACALLSEHTFDLVLCDMMMPDVDGIDVYDAFRAQPYQQHARFIIITGGAFTQKAQDFVDRESVPTCQKPVSVHTLRALVRDALANSQSTQPS